MPKTHDPRAGAWSSTQPRWVRSPVAGSRSKVSTELLLAAATYSHLPSFVIASAPAPRRALPLAHWRSVPSSLMQPSPFSAPVAGSRWNITTASAPYDAR